MGAVRDAVAGNVAEVLMFLGFALLFLGGGLGAKLVAVLGIVTFFAAVFLSEPLEELLRTDVEGTTREALGATDEADHAVAELRERYAAGEIDEAEFEHRLDRLLETEDVDPTVEAGTEHVREAE